MKHVVSFSGGRTSAYLVHLMEQKRKVDGLDVSYIFMDTGAEHQKTYEFVRNVSKHFGVEITCLRVDVNPELGKGNSYKVVSIDDICQDLQPWKDMIKKYGVPYYGGAFCTDRMKLGPFTKYCNDNFGKSGYTTLLGIRFDEPNRILGKDLYVMLGKAMHVSYYDCICIYECIKNYGYRSVGWWLYGCDRKVSIEIFKLARKLEKKIDSTNITYLAELSDFEKDDVLDWWSEQEFDLGIDEWNGNCVFCIKKSELKLAAAQRDNAEHYIEFLEMLDGDDVRTGYKAGSKDSMYRKKRSLQQVVAMFDGSTGSEIKSRIRGAKMTDTGSCSESCEVFNCQIDMFD